MTGSIKGKQIANATIVQDNLNITTDSITTSSSVFSPDDSTLRVISTEQVGDYLY